MELCRTSLWKRWSRSAFQGCFPRLPASLPPCLVAGFMAENKTGSTFIVKIKRQQRPDEAVRWEEYELRYSPPMNVIQCLRDIAEKPYTREGKESTPVSYDANCLEEVCGACAMLINGEPRQACSALVDNLAKPIRLEPLTKFPLVRDLVVDRTHMFESLKRTKFWIPIDGTYALG